MFEVIHRTRYILSHILLQFVTGRLFKYRPDHLSDEVDFRIVDSEADETRRLTQCYGRLVDLIATVNYDPVTGRMIRHASWIVLAISAPTPRFEPARSCPHSEHR